MFEPSNYAVRVDSAVRSGALLGEYVLPGLRAAASVACAGGLLGAVTGLVTGGMKCLSHQGGGALTFVDAARVLGRDITIGAASGVAASAASLYVSAAGATVCAAISAPAWAPPAAAVAAAIGVGYVVMEASHQVWDRWVA